MEAPNYTLFCVSVRSLRLRNGWCCSQAGEPEHQGTAEGTPGWATECFFGWFKAPEKLSDQR